MKGKRVPGDVDELADVFSFFTDDDTTSKTEITVEPGVPQTTSVSLDGELLELLRLLLGSGLELQTRTIRVSSHDAKAVSWLLLEKEGERKKRKKKRKKRRRRRRTYCFPTEKAMREDWLRVKK